MCTFRPAFGIIRNYMGAHIGIATFTVYTFVVDNVYILLYFLTHGRISTLPVSMI